MNSPSSGMLSWRGKHLDCTVRAASLDSFIPGCVGVVVDLVGGKWRAASFSANWAILGYESESGQISPVDTNCNYLEFCVRDSGRSHGLQHCGGGSFRWPNSRD